MKVLHADGYDGLVVFMTEAEWRKLSEVPPQIGAEAIAVDNLYATRRLRQWHGQVGEMLAEPKDK